MRRKFTAIAAMGLVAALAVPGIAFAGGRGGHHGGGHGRHDWGRGYGHRHGGYGHFNRYPFFYGYPYWYGGGYWGGYDGRFVYGYPRYPYPYGMPGFRDGNYRIDTSPESLAAFQALADDPYFN